MKTDASAPDSRSDPAENFPDVEDLRSLDERTSRRAWERAYPVLWREAMLAAHGHLNGARFEQDREDLAARALSQFQQLVMRGTNDFRNQGKSPRWHVRNALRFHRQRRVLGSSGQSPEGLDGYRSPSLGDAGQELDALCQAVREAAAALDPPLPELFADRLDGLTAEETAAKRGMNRNTVLSHWLRGIKELQVILRQLDF